MVSRQLACGLAAGLLGVSAHAMDWTQWGGPTRDFKSPSTGLAAKWPESGPKTLWKRPLGEGYSAIVAADGLVFTMFRSDNSENVVALSADNGETRWTHTYDAPLLPDTEQSFGKGPNATPLLAGGRLVTVGFTGKVHCLDAKSGKPLWSFDVFKDMAGTFLKFGYSASPLLYKDAVVLPIGKKGAALGAFNLTDGKPRWISASFENSYSSPIMVDVGGKKQITLVSTNQILGFDAENGDQLWSHPYKNQWDTHCTTPVDCGNGRVFYPSFEGGILLELKADADQTQVKELWTTKRVGAGQTNVLCVRDHLYGASGSGKAGFFAAVSLSDGKEIWRERIPLATALYADGRLLVLDEAGTLRMLNAGGEKYEPICQAALLENKAWTAPTLDGGKMFLRDQKNILALDLTSAAK